jgi:hypothetical protein
MADEHPAVTWGDLKSWAEQNGVPDDAEMTDKDTDQPFRDIDYSPAEDAIEADPEVPGDEGEPAKPAQLILAQEYDG